MFNLILSSSPGQVIPKTIKLSFVASPPSTQLEGVRVKMARNQPVEKCTDISVTFPGRCYGTYVITLLLTYDTAHSLLFQSTSIMNIQQKMSSTKRISSSQRTVTCSRHDIAEKFLIWH